LKKYFDGDKIIDLSVGALLFSLAVFVRIDSLGFGALYLLIPFYFRKRWLRRILIAGIIQFSILIICYLIFALIYGYTLNAFFEQNIIFNFIYKKLLIMVLRRLPVIISLLKFFLNLEWLSC